MKKKSSSYRPRVHYWTTSATGARVKLTLCPFQTLKHMAGGPTDEGYHFDYREYSYNYLDGTDILAVQEVWHRRSLDCDGPRVTHDEFWAIDLTGGGRVYLGEKPVFEIMGNGAKCIVWEPQYDETIKTPDWKRGCSYQRDIFAERAGY